MKIYHRSAFDRWPIENNSIQSVVTSPPYYLCRVYDIPDTKIGDWVGQYGREASPQKYIENTMLWLKEAWRVLRDDGIMFIVIDDKYAGSGMGTWKNQPDKPQGKNIYQYPYDKYPKDRCFGYKRKSLLLIPERLMIAMSDAGWIIRNKIIWIRTMPESCKDRFSAQLETIIFATKSPKYYFNLDAVKEPLKQITIERYKHSLIKKEDAEIMGSPRARYHRKTAKLPKETGMCGGGHYAYGGLDDPDGIYQTKMKEGNNPLFKNPGNVWLDYYLNTAKEFLETFGIEEYIKALKFQILSETDIFPPMIQGLKEEHYAPFSGKLVKRLILCSTRAGDIVLDPFVGSGTTVRMAEELNRIGYGIDLGYKEVFGDCIAQKLYLSTPVH